MWVITPIRIRIGASQCRLSDSTWATSVAADVGAEHDGERRRGLDQAAPGEGGDHQRGRGAALQDAGDADAGEERGEAVAQRDAQQVAQIRAEHPQDPGPDHAGAPQQERHRAQQLDQDARSRTPRARAARSCSMAAPAARAAPGARVGGSGDRRRQHGSSAKIRLTRSKAMTRSRRGLARRPEQRRRTSVVRTVSARPAGAARPAGYAVRRRDRRPCTPGPTRRRWLAWPRCGPTRRARRSSLPARRTAPSGSARSRARRRAPRRRCRRLR